MGAATLKARTAITLRDEMEVSLKSLEMLPELLQVRATLDKGWSREYSRAYARGEPMPPILVFELPDGRLVTVDGFHRVDACLSIGLKSIRAQIRRGTMHEALLAAIEANTAAFHRGRPFDEDDKRHAARMMIVDPVCREWGNERIASHCGLSSPTVSRIRNETRETMGIPIPEYVTRSDGRRAPYQAKRSGEKPRISRNSSDPKCAAYKASVGGVNTYLGRGEDESKARLDLLLAERQGRKDRVNLKHIGYLLVKAGLHFEAALTQPSKYPGMRGRRGRGFVLTSTTLEAAESVCWAIGCLALLRELSGDLGARMICVCYPEDGPQASIDLARKLGVEFLTPEELVASLAPPG